VRIPEANIDLSPVSDMPAELINFLINGSTLFMREVTETGDDSIFAYLKVKLEDKGTKEGSETSNKFKAD